MSPYGGLADTATIAFSFTRKSTLEESAYSLLTIDHENVMQSVWFATRQHHCTFPPGNCLEDYMKRSRLTSGYSSLIEEIIRTFEK